MVNKKQSKRQRDIKSKLMAAICMLLVSSIMMVSSTYAWFTLSTAPEVTGITTAVGANGNLEMALLPASGELDDIGSAAGDSLLADVDRNVTWGNLVDVSDDSYGLENITLYPATLNLDSGNKLAASVLKTPTYGADGRVAELLANTFTGIFDTDTGSFSPDEDSYGVRAVGTASGMTDRQLSYRNARANANSATAQATQLASKSLTDNGGSLANVAIKKGTGKTDFTQAEVDALGTIITDLQEDILPQIEKAYMQYILAYAASKANTAGDAVWTAVKNLVEADGATLDSVQTGLTTAGLASLPTQLTTAISAYEQTVTKVATAQTNFDTINKNDADHVYAWSDLSNVLYALADPDEMQVNDIPAGEIMDGDNMNTLVNSVAGGAGLVVSMASGGGVYADIADQCGNFTANVEIEKVEYGSLSLGPLSAKMNTKSDVNPSYLALVGTAVEGAGAPDSTAGDGSVPITDMFGYIIDMAFRTNAADSNLLLQPDAVDRIYTSNGTNGVENTYEDENGVQQTDTTMGNGASMTFTSTTNGFGNDKVAELMNAIRIVFFNPDTGDIYANAKLDTANAETTADGGLKAKMYLYTTSAGGTTYTEATDEQLADTNVTLYVESTTTEGTYDAVTDRTTIDTANTYYVATTTAAGEVKSTDNVIMPLTQNTATKLSALVYLEGEEITNSDVAATAATSVTGTMNLQFASSATLVPMDYTPLQSNQGNAAGDTETPVTPAG